MPFIRGPIARGIVVALVGIAVVIAVAVFLPASFSQALSFVSGAHSFQQVAHSTEVVWGKVPYCACMVAEATATSDSATAKVVAALQKANLGVKLNEQSPRDGWLYFGVTYDPHAATRDQIATAIETGGGQVLDGPP
jgi:hypothetical protein